MTPTESIYQRAAKLSAGANTVSIQAISQRESWLNMEQATRVWESSTSEVCQEKKNVYIILLRLPETSNPKIQTGNTPRLFSLFCLHAAHVWYTPHPTDAIFHAAMLVDCRQITRKLKNICASSVCKTSSSFSVSRKTGFLGNRYYWKVVHSNILKIYKHISW